MEKLAQAYEAYFPIGAAISLQALRTHRRPLQHFNSVTPENYMKPVHVHPQEDEYNFKNADKIVDYAVRYKKKLRGHTLVWHKQTPRWFFCHKGGPAPRQLLLDRMEDHIGTLVGRFCTSAYAWDVVNEPVAEEDGAGLLRESPWRRIIGDDYIARAFAFARRADAACKLFLNEYDETQPGKSRRIEELARALLADGVPINGIGMQGHYSVYGPGGDEICEAIERFASLGLEVQITELDISLYGPGDTAVYTAPPPELLALQARRYREVFGIFRRYHRYISGVTLWGVADDLTWLSNHPVKKRQNWPLLFDEAHRPKPALEQLLQSAQK